MAKKQVRKTARPNEAIDISSSAPSSSNRSYSAEFNPDYSQTIKDLRRIGILATSFFVILVVLSFFLG